MASGSIATAFFGSCCALPLLLMAMGTSSIGLAATLAPYRIYFIVGTVLLLSFSFYLVYFKRTPACDEGQLCSTKSQKVTKIMLWVAVALTLIFLIGPDIIVRFM